MHLEIHQIATVDDIQAIELECTKTACGGLVRIKVDRFVTQDHMTCPNCSEVWWHAHAPSNERGLVEAILGKLHNQHRSNPPASAGVKNPPRVRLVLPGCLPYDPPRPPTVDRQ